MTISQSINEVTHGTLWNIIYEAIRSFIMEKLWTVLQLKLNRYFYAFFSSLYMCTQHIDANIRQTCEIKITLNKLFLRKGRSMQPEEWGNKEREIHFILFNDDRSRLWNCHVLSVNYRFSFLRIYWLWNGF